MEDIIIALHESYNNENNIQNNKNNNKLCYKEFKNINKECFYSTDKYIEYNCKLYIKLYNKCMIIKNN